MAVLEKIRVKFGILITVLIGVALLSFIVDPSTLETTLRYFSSKYDVGKIDGNRISYEEYQSKLDYYTKVYNLTTGNQAVSESAMENLKETAWQSLISDLYIIPQMESAGIAVGEEELIDMSQGKEISPVIAQDPIFMDATGNFSREQLLEFIQSIPTDASGNLAMIYLTQWSQRLTYEELNKYFPDLIQGIINNEYVGFILVKSQEHGDLAIGKNGTYFLDSGEIEGENPLEGFGKNAALFVFIFSIPQSLQLQHLQKCILPQSRCRQMHQI